MVLQQRSVGFTTRIRKFYNKDQVVIQQGSGGSYYSEDIFGIGANIRISREMLCLPYAEFLFFNTKTIKYLFQSAYKMVDFKQMNLIFPEIFVPQDFTTRTALGFIGPTN